VCASQEEASVIGEGKVLKQTGGRGYYARVQVDCQNVGEQPSSVTLDPAADDGWHRAEGWTDAAITGAALGLKIAEVRARCTITRIHGMICETNSTLVAVAAVRAVWQAIGYEPAEELAARLEASILRRSELKVSDLEDQLD